MPDPKLYIEVLNDGSQDLYIRDAEAQEEIANIKETIKKGGGNGIKRHKGSKVVAK